MSKKIKHVTPPGFRRYIKNDRVIFDPNNAVRSTHTQFLTHAKQFPINFHDSLPDVRRHLELGHRFFLKTDLSSAFDQVTFELLSSVLQDRGINLGRLLPLEYFFHEKGLGGLIQGAPASPYLFETYCRYGGLDRDLYEYCDKLGFHCTRYVDDILVSSARFLGRRVSPKIRAIVGKYGFALSNHKTKIVDTRSEPLEVLGYVIRGARIDPNPKILQALHDLDLSDESRTGIFRWMRHVVEQGRRRRVVHK